MIRTLIASTESIDDVDAAVEDIKKQLDCGKNLLKNAVGIVSCHYEFIHSGVYKAVCEALPFDVLGAITSVHGNGKKSAILQLTVMLLTSDDVRFKTVLSPSLKTEPGKNIEEACRNAMEGEAEKPSLLFTFAPFMIENSGDEYVSVLTNALDGIPCFGTLAVDDTADFHECYMLCNGESYHDRMSLILCYGNINPRFFLATMSEEKIIDPSVSITSSEGHILKEVNGRPVVEWFEQMGLARASQINYAMTSLPFMLDYNDGTPPVSRVFINLNENRQAICAGAVPEGSILYIGVFDKEDVLLTSGRTIAEALGGGAAQGMLIYSCVSRCMSLGGDQFAELDLITKETGDKCPFLMAYSGGEICPTQTNKNAAVNRFHNNTFVVCIF
ncbi:MAG: FIST C-terminal domain-containing protein [Treponema sp.]|jgi:hypothetical protein|nr:FIST C-terminal domain-containing protein [Treponema sp.]